MPDRIRKINSKIKSFFKFKKKDFSASPKILSKSDFDRNKILKIKTLLKCKLQIENLNPKYFFKTLKSRIILKKAFALATIFAVIVTAYWQNARPVEATTYTWLQTDWSSGSSGTGRTHAQELAAPGGWYFYNNSPAKDANVSATTSLTLTTTPGTAITQTYNSNAINGFNLTGRDLDSGKVEVLPAGTGGEDASVKLSPNGSVSGSANFSYTGAQQTWVVPTGVTSINVDTAGAKGGSGGNYSSYLGGSGGNGGRVQTTLSVTAGSTLYIYVGGTSSYNGGGIGGAVGPSAAAGGEGGGASDIRIDGIALTNRVAIAAGGGGGGGAGYFSVAGAGGTGGGTVGTGGSSGNIGGGGEGGGGGTQSAGGSGGYANGTGGAAGTGGNGGNASAYGGAGGGGGGGLYGGGGGGKGADGSGSSGGGGGGGSSYSSGTSTTHTSGYQSGNGYANIFYPPYYSSGTFTSGIINIGYGVPSWGNLSWTKTGTGTIAMKARTCAASDPTCASATAWGSCTSFSSTPANIASDTTCVHSGDSYIQYQATLSTADTTVTPSLDDVTVNYNYYPTNQTLTSSTYDSNNTSNKISSLVWNETNPLPTGTEVKLQVRSSSDGATWTMPWQGPGGDNTYFTNSASGCSKPSGTTVTCATIPAVLTDGSNDRYFQYRATLNSSGANKPDVYDVTTYYQYNLPPNTPSSLGPAAYVNGSWGTSNTPTLQFTQSDPDPADTVKYTIQIATDSGFTTKVVDYTSVLIAQGATSFTVGQAAGGGTYTIGSQGQTLANSANYYWRVMTTDNYPATSSWATANGGSIAFKVDTTTPNVVAADAGASSGDRTSLTSNTWFKYSDTGSDDQISFSWTDPASISDDTFYYELNALSGNSVDGTESSTANPYIDSITVTEGTNYFHVRPRNGALTWGTERIFIVKYDKTNPASTTISWTTPTNDSTPTLTLSATDSVSGTNQMRFSCNNSSWSTAVAYATSYSAFDLNTGAGCSSGDGAKTVYVQYSDNAGNWSNSVNQAGILDTQPPLAPVLTCTNYADNTWVSSSASTTCTINDTATPSPRTATAYAINGSWSDNSNILFITFSPSEGTTTVQMRISDTGGGPTSSNTWTIKRDIGAPTSPSISWLTPTKFVTPALTLSATDPISGPSQMRFSCNGSSWSTPPVSYATSYSGFNINTGAGCTSGDGAKTIYAQFADAAGNWSASANQAGTLDTANPSSTITAICSTGGNNCTLTGEGEDPQEAYAIDSLSGTAADTLSGLDSVEISIKDTDVSVDKWYSPISNDFDQTSEYWLAATGTDAWSYDTSAVTWTLDHIYQIHSKPVDNAGNEQSPPQSLNFKFVNSPPAITNLTSVVQKEYDETNPGEVVISGYTLADVESCPGGVGNVSWVNLFSKAGATLNESLAADDTTAITLTNTGYLPDAGTIMLDEEVITYTAKNGNDLVGTINRGTNNTLAAVHNSNPTIWLKANAFSSGGSNLGSGISCGSHGEIIWTAKDDLEYYSATQQIKIVANDGAASSMIGSLTSSNFTFDTLDPVPGIHPILIDASEATITDPVSPAALTFSATDDTAKQMKVGLEPDLTGSSWETYSPSKDLNLEADPDTVYVQYRDLYNNETTIYETTTPETPTAAMVQDNSNLKMVPSEYKLFLSWRIFSNTSPPQPFESYKIYRSANATDWDFISFPPDGITNYDMNYYSDSTTVYDQLYYYKIKTTDEDGNISYFSQTMRGKANGTQDEDEGGGGTAPGDFPVITNVTPGTPTSTSVNITWETDDPSDSVVQYMTATGGDFEANNALSKGNATFADSDGNLGDHSVTLTNLAPDTTYYFQVISTTASGAAATSKDGINGYTFHTADGPGISNISVSSETNDGATISWDTTNSATSYVYYSTNADLSSATKLGSDELTTAHEITLSGLTEDTPYYFQVESTDANAATETDPVSAPYLTFQTNDQTGPVISNLTDSQLITDTQATIYFTTDEGATTLIEYGLADGVYTTGSTTYATYDRTHYIRLFGLTSQTQYFYRITTEDISGNQTQTTGDFQTNPAPGQDHDPLDKIENIEAAVVTDTKAVIKFDTLTETDDPVGANCTIEYGTTTDLNEVPIDEEDDVYDETHSIHLTGLIFSTTYFYQVICEDNLDPPTVVTDNNSGAYYSFTTAEDSTVEEDATAPKISSVGTSAITGESVTVSWDTDEEANSLVKYGITSGTYEGYGGDSTVNDEIANYDTAHTVVINGLVPGTKYYYKVISYDATGNFDESDESSFTTKAASSLGSIEITSTKLGEATITWKTSEKTTSVVEYGISDIYGDNKESTTLTQTHEISISGLKQNIKYHLRVGGKDGNNNLYTSGDYTFTPKSPPVISAVKVASTDEHSATIAFTTSAATDALITYTPSGAASASAEASASQGQPELKTNHEVILKNLTAGTTYSYVIQAKDIDGNSTTHPSTSSGQATQTLTFTTGVDTVPPKIDQVRTDSALAQNDKVQTIISWITDELSNTALIYKEGQQAEPKEVKISDNPTTNHIAVITIFKPGTVYYFKVKSTDLSGNSATSSDFALLTPKRKENIIQIIISNFQDIFGWAKF